MTFREVALQEPVVNVVPESVQPFFSEMENTLPFLLHSLDLHYQFALCALTELFEFECFPCVKLSVLDMMKQLKGRNSEMNHAGLLPFLSGKTCV